MATASLFLSSYPTDLGTVTASTELSTLPATNLQKLQPARVWDANATNATITIQLATATACTAIALIAHNLGSSATLRFRGATSQANLTAAPTVDSGVVSAWPASGKFDAETADGFPNLSSLITVTNVTALTWWSLLISAGSATSIRAGRVMVGKAIRPTINFGNNLVIQPTTHGEVRRSDFNQVTAEERGDNGRRIVLPFAAIDKTDFRKYILPFQMRHGNARDFFFSADPSAQEEFLAYSGQFLFEDMTEFTRQRMLLSGGATWAGGMQLIEVT